MKRLLYILRPVLIALLPLLLTLAPARAQTVVYTGDTTPLGVDQVGDDTYKWELYDNGTGNFATKADYCPSTSAAFTGGVDTGPSVKVNWLKAGTYFFKVTATNVTGCTSNFKIGILEVKENLPTAVIADPTPVCAGQADSLKINLTGTGPWSFTYTDGTTEWPGSAGALENPYTLIIDSGPVTNTNYRITTITDQNGTNPAGSNTVTQQVNPLPTPSAIYHN